MIALLLLCAAGFVSQAQAKVYPPKAILIKLNTKSAAIAHLQKQGLHTKADLLKKDIDTLNARLVRDWKDHFSYCPVYFFADTSLDEVLAGRLEAVLFDTAYRAIQPGQAAALNQKFYIAYLGLRSQDEFEAAGGAPGSTQLPSLQVNDAEMQPLGSYQLSSSMNGDLVSFLFASRGDKGYRFRSRMFQLDYFPLAAKYEKKLRHYWEE